MKTKVQPALKMLAAALEMEEKGEQYYRKAAKGSKNELGKKVFSMLALDEVVHLERIRKIYAALETDQAWSASWTKLPIRHLNLGGVFQTLAKKYGPEITTKSSDLKALEIGLTFEAKSVKFYLARLQKAADKIEKDFLTHMVEEERGHHQALSDMKLYLEDPSSWFREKEKGGLDGA
jgi:rubrerythrin